MKAGFPLAVTACASTQLWLTFICNMSPALGGPALQSTFQEISWLSTSWVSLGRHFSMAWRKEVTANEISEGQLWVWGLMSTVKSVCSHTFVTSSLQFLQLNVPVNIEQE